jgi:hypothetical protein
MKAAIPSRGTSTKRRIRSMCRFAWRRGAWIAAVFRDAGSTVTVRRNTERVGDSDCYVIEAKTNRGKYAVWIDPEHGYNIAKAETSKSGKNLNFRKPLDQCIAMGLRFASTRNTIGDVRFQKIGDLWVPVQATLRNVTLFSDGSKSVSTQRYRRTEVVVNPDHDVLGSFLPKFPNGSTVRVYGKPPRSLHVARRQVC